MIKPAILLLSAAATLPAGAAPLPLWEAGVIGGVVGTPAYPGAAERSSRFIPFPYLIYRGRILRSDQDGIGARLLKSDRVEFDLGFAASLPARSDDIAARRGMPNLGPLGEFGPRVRFKLTRPAPEGQLWFDLPLRAVLEARGGIRKRGWIAEPRLLWEIKGPDDRWNADLHVAAALGDRAINRYFYEVAPIYATPDRAAYAADAGLIEWRLGASGSWKIGRDLRLYAYTRYENFAAAANTGSPLHLRGHGFAGGIGLSWVLARASIAAHD